MAAFARFMWEAVTKKKKMTCSRSVDELKMIIESNITHLIVGSSA